MTSRASRQMRLIYTADPGRAMPEHAGKVFAVIGPLKGHTDQPKLQDLLERVLREYNLEFRS